jgi:HTH-type transcriptional regulator/antitoxin HigA
MQVQLEEICLKSNLTPEERTLSDPLTKLIDNYDETHSPIEETPPHEMAAYLMEQLGLKQADLVPLLGSRAQDSDVISGKWGISKAQAKELAAFFKLSTDLFI